MTQINSIDDILNDPDFDSILVPEPTKISQTKTTDQRLVDSFLEINEFFKQNNRVPDPQSEDINERKLDARLVGFRASSDKTIILKKYDDFNLLPAIEQSQTVEEYSFSKEEVEDLDIFRLQHITQKKREDTDFVAKRKPCKDFARFEPIFKECHQKLKSGEYKFTKFSEDHINENSFFVVSGVLAFVADLKQISQDKFSKKDGRTRIIFENGLESNMKFRSFGKALFSGGKSIVPNTQTNLVSSDNLQTGYIYVLKSLSTNPEISNIKNLYKIGYSTTIVEERIKNAKVDPTYLNAEVKIVETFKTIDLNPQKLENLLHRFFADSCLNVLIDDGKGGKLKPREWFIAPLEVIEEVVDLILNGNIVNYIFNPKTESIELSQ